MKNITNQYTDLKEGRMSQANFMRNVRMTFPHLVTNVTSFDDTIKILKNKGLLIEKKINKKQLEMGVEVEKEHTKSTKKAKKIAQDHLKEKPDYYTRLKKAGLEEEYPKDEIVIKGGPKKPIKEQKGSSGKEQYANFNEIDNLNSQEVLIGIDCEMQIDTELSKEEATKIVIKNLKKDPNYYTNYAIAGKETAAEPMYKFKEGSDQMKPVKGEDSFIDKENGMKTPKDVEKVKASAAKANKETNKVVKGVEYMKLTAKTVRGVKKMDATGEKMKKINVKESLKASIKQLIAKMLK